tara:strand:+ start:7609 stop:8298 length:690 start_codon:yes stop_codon:yes gene_type:complete
MNIAIICAAGKGKRMNAAMNKVFLTIMDNPIIWHTLNVFEKNENIDKIIIVTSKEDVSQMMKFSVEFSKVNNVIEGGKERQDSVYNGIQEASKFCNDDDIVLIHNGANPLVSQETINKTIEAANEHGASVAAMKVKDTIKLSTKKDFVRKTLDRDKLWAMQTPQVIRFGLAKQAFDKAFADNFYSTDDVALVEYIGGKVKLVECNPENIKITTPDDIILAEKILENKNG